MSLVLDAPAKVNLVLRVGPPGADGYHPLGTVFCALDLADTVEITPDHPEGPGLEVAFAVPLRHPPELGDAASNLAVRAARGFFERAGFRGAAPRLRLVKRVPPGGGLGGGSSDAAAVLRGLARLYPEAVAAEALRELAAGLGADVPFFMLDTPTARATGRGDRVEPVPALPPRPVVLVLPRFGVSTPAAYRWLDEDRGSTSGIPDAPAPASWEEVEGLAANDLEAPVFARHPALRELRDRLRELGAGLSLMAGSGSSVFGVFEEADAARTAASALQGEAGVSGVVLTATRRARA